MEMYSRVHGNLLTGYNHTDAVTIMWNLPRLHGYHNYHCFFPNRHQLVITGLLPRWAFIDLKPHHLRDK